MESIIVGVGGCVRSWHACVYPGAKRKDRLLQKLMPEQRRVLRQPTTSHISSSGDRPAKPAQLCGRQASTTRAKTHTMLRSRPGRCTSSGTYHTPTGCREACARRVLARVLSACWRVSRRGLNCVGGGAFGRWIALRGTVCTMGPACAKEPCFNPFRPISRTHRRHSVFLQTRACLRRKQCCAE